MKPKEIQRKKCSRLTYKKQGFHENSILLGIVIDEDDRFVTFQTGRKKHIISKDSVIAIEETDVVFIEADSVFEEEIPHD